MNCLNLFSVCEEEKVMEDMKVNTLYEKFFNLPQISTDTELEEEARLILTAEAEYQYKRLLLMTEDVIKVDAYEELLANVFNRVKPLVKGKHLSTLELCWELNEEFRHFKIYFLGVGVTDKQYSKIGLEKASAEDDEFNTIRVLINENCEKYFNVFSDNYIDRILTFINHELIHREQAVRMKSREIITKNFDKTNKYKTTAEYISDPQEMMAFAYTIVEDVRMRGWSDSEIISGLKSFNLESPVWYEYSKNFTKDSDVMKTVVKNIYSYVKD